MNATVENMKYPRTYHLPFSPGATSDDKKIPWDFDWFGQMFAGKEVVISEKLDGENSCFTHFDVYSRSHGAPTRSPWSRNLWANDGLLWKIKDFIAEDEQVFGENLFGIHSIEYDKLPAYFFIFAIKNDDRWYSWDEIEEYAKMIDVPTVPVIFRGILKDAQQLENICNQVISNPSHFGKTAEGCVIRIADSFPVYDEGQFAFPQNVAKFVRPNHVQTDTHWTNNWKKANLIIL